MKKMNDPRTNLSDGKKSPSANTRPKTTTATPIPT